MKFIITIIFILIILKTGSGIRMEFKSNSTLLSNTNNLANINDDLGKSDSNGADKLTNLYRIQQDIINTEHAKSFQLIKSFEWKTILDHKKHLSSDKNITCCKNFAEKYIDTLTKNAILENEDYFKNQTSISTNFINEIIQTDDSILTIKNCTIHKKVNIVQFRLECIDQSVSIESPTKTITFYKNIETNMKNNINLTISTLNDYSEKLFESLENNLNHAKNLFQKCTSHDQKIKKCANYFN